MASHAHACGATAFIIVAFLALLAAGCSDSGPSGPDSSFATILVDQSGAGDYLTIQDGIDAAASGDTVLVAPGTYAGPENRDLDFGGVDITLAATAGRDSTIIDCEGLGRAFSFTGNESSASVVRGFIIRNGLSDEGGALYCLSSDPTFEDVVFENNFSTAGGGAVTCIFASPGFEDVEFIGNEAGYLGGAVYCTASDPEFDECVFDANRASNGGAAFYCEAMSQPRVEGSVFTHNTTVGLGAGALVSGSSPSFVECTFYANGAVDKGDAIHAINGATPAVVRTILSYGTTGEPLTCATGAEPEVTHCCVFGNAGGDSLCGDHYDNIFEDPAFCDAASGDLTLSSGSPCLPDNNDWSLLVGAFGQGCEEPASRPGWGTIVAISR